MTCENGNLKTKILMVLILFPLWISAQQIRPFDNSRIAMPWIYNPAASFTKDFQAYLGYDGRGSSGITPRSILAGVRMPTTHGKRYSHKNPITMIGAQVLKTTQDLLTFSTVDANFAHQVSINRDLKLGMGLGMGIHSMNYNTDKLVYFDAHDPLIANATSYFHIHMYAGVAVSYKENFKIAIAAPYIAKGNRPNFDEIIFRSTYQITFTEEMNLIVAANIDTYNYNILAGGDFKVEYKKVFSLIAGGDNRKAYAGMIIDIMPFALSYIFSMNYSKNMNHVPTNQICIFSDIPFKR